MADQKLTALTENTAPLGTDLLYIVDDPSGVPVSQKIQIANLFEDFGVNLIMNSPGQIVTDGAEPQWWDDVANATITDEDTAGEGIPDTFERCFKVVTTANDVYGYQTLTFANESLLDAGVTVVSFSCWVYCASATKASIGIYGTNLGLQESDQVGAGAWTLLKVENITINAADTAIELRLIVDTNTAFFAKPTLNLGSKAIPWIPRYLMYQGIYASQYDLNTTGDVAWSDTDCTANTDPLALLITGWISISEVDGAIGSVHQIGHSDDVLGSDNVIARQYTLVNNTIQAQTVLGLCDDSQVLRYKVDEADADSDVRARFYITGYYRWAP